MRRLVEENLSAFDDSIARLKWLGEHIEVYVDRWVAFHTANDIPMSALLGSNFFTVIAVASDVMRNELGTVQADRRVNEAYKRFAEELLRVANLEERESTEQLVALAGELRVAVHDWVVR